MKNIYLVQAFFMGIILCSCEMQVEDPIPFDFASYSRNSLGVVRFESNQEFQTITDELPSLSPDEFDL